MPPVHAVHRLLVHIHTRPGGVGRHFSMRLLGLSTIARVVTAGRASLAVGERRAAARRPKGGLHAIT
jgi:hypothetical protein